MPRAYWVVPDSRVYRVSYFCLTCLLDWIETLPADSLRWCVFFFFFKRCFTSTDTLRTIRDGHLVFHAALVVRGSRCRIYSVVKFVASGLLLRPDMSPGS